MQKINSRNPRTMNPKNKHKNHFDFTAQQQYSQWKHTKPTSFQQHRIYKSKENVRTRIPIPLHKEKRTNKPKTNFQKNKTKINTHLPQKIKIKKIRRKQKTHVH